MTSDHAVHLAAVRTTCERIIRAAETDPETVVLHRGYTATERAGHVVRTANGSFGVTMSGAASSPVPVIAWGGIDLPAG